MAIIMVVWLHLVLHGDFCGESVVSVPLLGEVEAQVAHFVLGLQVTRWLPWVGVAGAWGGKLLRGQTWDSVMRSDVETKREERQKHTMSQDEATNGRKNINWGRRDTGDESRRADFLRLPLSPCSVRAFGATSLRWRNGQGRKAETLEYCWGAHVTNIWKPIFE